MQSQHRLASWTLFLAAAISGCSQPSGQSSGTGHVAENGVVTIYVVNYPLKYFAERVGGEYVRVVFPASADEDPAYWQPDADTITAYQQADLVLLNGATYAKWTNTVSLPHASVVDTTASVADQYITVEDAMTHSHGPGGEHAHAGTVFTTWLDPQIAMAQAEAIQQVLVRLRPEHEADFRENLEALTADLNELDQELGALVQGKSERAVCFSHPVYQYLQRRYHLNAKSVHWEPNEVPSPAMWDEFSRMLKQHPAKWMVWESAPIEENIKRLDALGLQSTVYETCGNLPVEGDFLTVMRQNATHLRRALGD